MSALTAHLGTGVTTVCRCWAITRTDGTVYGFTDHDRALTFDGIAFRADTGLTAGALVQGTGLSVDNGEAMGILSDAAISEDDIDAGRFDGATVRAWQVNWADVGARELKFCGAIGEIRRGAGAFHAELRGLTEMLNQPQGRVFQRGCGAVLGDDRCRFNLNGAGFSLTLPAEDVTGDQTFRFAGLGILAERWFERGTLRVLTGEGAGLSGLIKNDEGAAGAARSLQLWEPLRAKILPGDSLRLEPGCDKHAETCRLKFDNIDNFQGFPFIPGEDWLIQVPRTTEDNDGGSLFS